MMQSHVQEKAQICLSCCQTDFSTNCLWAYGHLFRHLRASGESHVCVWLNHHILFPADRRPERTKRLSSAWIRLGLSHNLSLTSQENNQNLSHPTVHHFLIAYFLHITSLYAVEAHLFAPVLFFHLLWQSNIKACSKFQDPSGWTLMENINFPGIPQEFGKFCALASQSKLDTILTMTMCRLRKTWY